MTQRPRQPDKTPTSRPNKPNLQPRPTIASDGD
ncbi:Protein of unknown function [Pyronema omphalodes CBS 100304]|uniref:Uncharacterized protein n=1 Tax=Pyronema omphalodes (strain CBS 100304) TaxID=1076935 RepID=U4LS13_PYROM|nr:Protein of unknown function [Pyronema omphalodes CBS 100304]